jgi:hypothetical protein
MKRALLLLSVALSVVLATSSPSPARTAGTAYVTPWIELELELDAIASHCLNPPRASRALAREVGLALGRRIGRVAVRAYGDG